MGYKNPEDAARYRERHREEARERARIWREEYPERAAFTKRNNWLKREYGIDLATYNEIFNKQGGVCAICKTPRKTRDLDVDHFIYSNETSDNYTIRGLLCNNCNRGLGHFKDSIEFLQSAIDYLKKFI